MCNQPSSPVPEPIEESPPSLYPGMFYLIKLFAVVIAVVVPIYEVKYYFLLAAVFLIAHFEYKKTK